MISEQLKLKIERDFASYTDRTQYFVKKEVEPFAEQAEKLAEAAKSALKKEMDRYNSEKEGIDWYNNNMPEVGQRIPYAEQPPLPEWVKELSETLSDWETFKNS